jgi:hypothetical protein
LFQLWFRNMNDQRVFEKTKIVLQTITLGEHIQKGIF